MLYKDKKECLMLYNWRQKSNHLQSLVQPKDLSENDSLLVYQLLSENQTDHISLISKVNSKISNFTSTLSIQKDLIQREITKHILNAKSQIVVLIVGQCLELLIQAIQMCQ